MEVLSMSSKEDYQLKVNEIKAVSENDIKNPNNIPV
jgi:hypothetical protein